MPATPEQVADWVRYFERRETEGFGEVGTLTSHRRCRCLDYVRAHCAEAAEVIEDGSQNSHDADLAVAA
nr:hypothetical protein [uncultured Lichenicoccus sp.]